VVHFIFSIPSHNSIPLFSLQQTGSPHYTTIGAAVAPRPGTSASNCTAPPQTPQDNA